MNEVGREARRNKGNRNAWYAQTKEQAQRNADIKLLRFCGASRQDLMARFDLSYDRVNEILRSKNSHKERVALRYRGLYVAEPPGWDDEG